MPTNATQESGNRGTRNDKRRLYFVSGFIPEEKLRIHGEYNRLVSGLSPLKIEFVKALVLTKGSRSGAVKLIHPGIDTNNANVIGSRLAARPEVQLFYDYLSSVWEGGHPTVIAPQSPLTKEEMLNWLLHQFRQTADVKTGLQLLDKIQKAQGMTDEPPRPTDRRSAEELERDLSELMDGSDMGEDTGQGVAESEDALFEEESSDSELASLGVDE